jgi:poly-gamma-glutamate capsule biosynthesis protein CapA/YwtB (metallophosphatase superfamily)
MVVQAWFEGGVLLGQRLDLDLAAAAQQRVVGAVKQIERRADIVVFQMHVGLVHRLGQ